MAIRWNTKAIRLVCITALACLGLTGCRRADYQEAIRLQEAKEYASAAAIYSELGEYKDAGERLAECEAAIDAIKAFEAAAASQEKQNALDAAISEAGSLISGEKSH